MFIGKDDRSTYHDHSYVIEKTIRILLKNEIELGGMFVTGRKSVQVEFLTVAYAPTLLKVSSLRDGVDWLVSKICSGKVYYHFISNITVFRLVYT